MGSISGLVSPLYYLCDPYACGKSLTDDTFMICHIFLSCLDVDSTFTICHVFLSYSDIDVTFTIRHVFLSCSNVYDTFTIRHVFSSCFNVDNTFTIHHIFFISPEEIFLPLFRVELFFFFFLLGHEPCLIMSCFFPLSPMVVEYLEHFLDIPLCFPLA